MIDRGCDDFQIVPGLSRRVSSSMTSTMFRVMKSAGEAGGLTLVHAENGVVISRK